MNIGDAKAFFRSPDSIGRNLGIPVIAIVGLPLLTLVIVLFLGFGLALQSQQSELTRNYSERTAEFLARDLADQLSQLLTPTAEYADSLAATLEKAKCTTAECAFDIVRMQRAASAHIPQQVAYVVFGARTGRLSSIFRLDQDDRGFLGTVQTSPGNPELMVVSEPGKSGRELPLNFFNSGWYQAAMTRETPAWKTSFKEGRVSMCKQGEGDSWSVHRINRVNDAFGKPLGVLAVNVCLSRASAFLQDTIGKTVEKIKVRAGSGEEVLIQRHKVTIAQNDAATGRADDQLVYKEVPLTDATFEGWRLSVALGPGLSQPAIWCWRHTLTLFAGLLSSIVLATVAAAFVVNPVKRLSRAVAEVGNLKLDKPIAVPTRVRELAFLASVIEKMRLVLHGNQTRLEFLAYHDPVSGFLNQAGLTRAFDALSAKPGHIDLILIKVRNYHHIAGIFGDAVLARLVARNLSILQAELEGSVVGCLNDNQIACLFSSAEDLDAPHMQHLLERMRKPYDDDGIRISASISASVATKQSHADRFDTLLRGANGAMHHAEETHSEEAIWYNRALVQDLRAALDFGGDIAQAIARGEFSVLYQPVVDLRTGRIQFAHTSVVWHHPEFGMIRSHKFVPILERNGSIRHLGLFVMSRAFEFLHQFKRRTAGQTLQIGIKLSFAQLMDPLFIERVTELQAEWGICAAEIRFIITQNVVMLEDQQLSRVMRKLRKLGFHLTIDQFAMAHSTVNGMTAIQYDSMMIGSPVHRGIEQPGVERIIFQAACELARKLGMDSIAAGIDNHAIIGPLVESGCSYGMGSWFGRSSDEREFLRRYDENAAMFSEDGRFTA